MRYGDLLLIAVLIGSLCLSAMMPPITDRGYLKPPIIIDPVSMNMRWDSSEVYPYSWNTGYATYEYAFCYGVPILAVMEVDVDPRGYGDTENYVKPKIISRYNVPESYDFEEKVTTDIDILDNIGYTRGWRFKYSKWVYCDSDYMEIVFEVYVNITSQGHEIYAGVGDPQGPDFVEPYDVDSYYVKVIGGRI